MAEAHPTITTKRHSSHKCCIGALCNNHSHNRKDLPSHVFPNDPCRRLASPLSTIQCTQRSWWNQTRASLGTGADPGFFFRRGCTRLLLYFNNNKPHSFFFFLQNTIPLDLPLPPPYYWQEHSLLLLINAYLLPINVSLYKLIITLKLHFD